MEEKLNQIKNEYNILKEKYISEKTILDRINKEIKNAQIKIEEKNKDEELLSKVDILFRETSNYAREQIKINIEDTVTAFLNTIFDEVISFEIELITDQASPAANFYVKTELDDRIIKVNPVDSRGGGIVDIVSLALRFSILDIYKNGLKGPIILDEPAKHVSYQYIDNVGKLINQVALIKDRQIIIITHNNYLAESGDLVYEITQYDGESIVNLITEDTQLS